MAFLAPLAASIGLGASTVAGASAAALIPGSLAISSATAAGIVAGTAAPIAFGAAAPIAVGAAAGWSALWSALSVGFSALSTVGQIMSNNAAARAAMEEPRLRIETTALERARLARDQTRETGIAASRRTAILAASGGLEDGSDLIREVLMEGSLEGVRRSTDLSFQEGVLTRRFTHIGRGAARSNLGALASGGARIAGLLT